MKIKPFKERQERPLSWSAFGFLSLLLVEEKLFEW
jgi:hypothetical protein